MLKNIQINNLFEYLKKLIVPNKNQNNILYLISLFYLMNLSLVIIFGRPFVGILILNQQLGKAYVLGGAIVLIILICINIFKRNIIPEEMRTLVNLSIFIILGFLISMFFNEFEINMYLFKSSSYIWSIGYIGFGYYFLSKINKELIVLIVFLSAFSLYFISVINYPNFIIDIFISSSDKFQLVKAADSLLIFVILNLIIERYSNLSDNLKIGNRWEWTCTLIWNGVKVFICKHSLKVFIKCFSFLYWICNRITIMELHSTDTYFVLFFRLHICPERFVTIRS